MVSMSWDVEGGQIGETHLVGVACDIPPTTALGDSYVSAADAGPEARSRRARSTRGYCARGPAGWGSHRIGELLEHVAVLTQRLAELTERLGQNSRNSHLPPSSDPPGSAGKGGGQRRKSGRPRGGQRGHRGSRRKLVPADKVDEVVDLYPAECENC